MNHQNYLRVTLCAVVGTALLSGCALSRDNAYPDYADDAHITADVEAALAQHPDLSPPNEIYVDTREHVVYLTGIVGGSLIRENAIAVTRSVPGVNEVVSNVSVEN